MANGHTLQAISICLQTGVVPYIEGPPGVGKSSAIAQLAEEVFGVPFHTEIGSLDEPIDLKGIPTLGQPIDISGHSLPTTVFAPPEFALNALRWAEESAKALAGIIFLDELPDCPPAVQAGLLRPLIADSRGYHWVGQVAIPPSIAWIAAGNPPEMSTGGWGLRPAIANRMAHFEWENDAEKWAEGFMASWPTPTVPMVADTWKEGPLTRWRGLVATYIRTNRAELLAYPQDETQASQAWPSNRSWSFLSRVLAGAEASGTNGSIRNVLAIACVGAGAAPAFLKWVQNLDLPDPSDIVADPENAALPTRSDQAMAAAINLAAFVAEATTAENWIGAWVYIGRIGEAFMDDTVMAAALKLAQMGRPDGVSKIPAAVIRFGRLRNEIQQLVNKPDKT